MKAIFEPVYNTAGVEQLNKELAKDGGRTVMVSGCIDTQKLHFSSAIASNYNFQLVITSDEGKARDMAEDARFFNGGNVMYYPAKDVIFYNADVQGRQIAVFHCFQTKMTIYIRYRTMICIRHNNADSSLRTPLLVNNSSTDRKIGGSFTSPKVSVDTKSMANQAVEAVADEAISKLGQKLGLDSAATANKDSIKQKVTEKAAEKALDFLKKKLK